MGSKKNRGMHNRLANKANTFTPLTEDEELANELQMVATEIRADLIKMTARLAINIKLIADAINCGEIDCRLPVRSVMDTFTVSREIKQLIACVDPKSRFYNNQTEVIALVQCLSYLGKEGYFSYQDSLNTVLKKLTERYAENEQILKS
jgi:hypothetical protein